MSRSTKERICVSQDSDSDDDDDDSVDAKKSKSASHEHDDEYLGHTPAAAFMQSFGKVGKKEHHKDKSKSSIKLLMFFVGVWSWLADKLSFHP